MSAKTIFVSADHGLALIYFLQSEVVSTLQQAGFRVVVLVADAMVGPLTEQNAGSGILFEGLQLDQAASFAARERGEFQWWLQFLRRVGGSRRINTAAMDSYIRQVAVEEPNRRRLLMPLAWLTIALLRRSAAARKALIRSQQRLSPQIYADLFDRYRPALVVASTPGWRLDRYLLREAADRGIQTATVIVGWDNPSSYSLPGAQVDWATCWSGVQRDELVQGSDWGPERVNIGGIPSYDGYFRRQWTIPRDEYFAMHGLDPRRKLLSYACSFVTFSPNLRNVKALASLISENGLASSAQLLVRLHPNHFLNVHLFAQEREVIRQIAADTPNMHVVEPAPLGGDLGHYSGEDMSEKSSMMAHSDVFITVYSTMVVETAIHDRPIVSLCLDTPGGWRTPRKYSLPLSQIGNWPTHQRFRAAGAGRVADSEEQLAEVVCAYLDDPLADRDRREAFIRREVTYTDGSAGRRTGEFLAGLA
ncbi:MAG: CDP-glycerol glycerophosphotransferase family protein [Chloroflexi bacterium]|nr:CDP-glycerol glycerophosphotransferase family protein [Chloroflexota bacterium]